jgi:hypothetical protein
VKYTLCLVSKSVEYLEQDSQHLIHQLSSWEIRNSIVYNLETVAICRKRTLCLGHLDLLGLAEVNSNFSAVYS